MVMEAGQKRINRHFACIPEPPARQTVRHADFNKRDFYYFWALTVAFKLFLLSLLSSLALPATALDYVIDPGHTYASFEIDHLGFSTQRGQFNRTSGQVGFDLEERRGHIDITIAAASLDTGWPCATTSCAAMPGSTSRLSRTSCSVASTLFLIRKN
jgi:hypothetical protein